jgi:hypothetical protein
MGHQNARFRTCDYYRFGPARVILGDVPNDSYRGIPDLQNCHGVTVMRLNPHSPSPSNPPPQAGSGACGRRPHSRLPQSRRANQWVEARESANQHVRPRRAPENASPTARRHT